MERRFPRLRKNRETPARAIALANDWRCDDMRLGTFNVWGLPEAFSDDVSSRMRALVERLEASNLDILLIQEAWMPEVRRTLRQGARRAGFAVSEGRGASGGLMTLSRLPIRSSRFVG